MDDFFLIAEDGGASDGTAADEIERTKEPARGMGETMAMCSTFASAGPYEQQKKKLHHAPS